MTAPLSHADLAARFRVLARLAPPASPVVSAYLDTGWADEQQRERARAFLRSEIRKTRAGAAPELEADLAWLEKRGAALIEQTWSPDTRAVALFACRCAGLREVLPLSVSVQDCFAVGATPHVGQLAAVLEAPPGTRVACIDGDCARLAGAPAERLGEAVALDGAFQAHRRRAHGR
jgi:DNA-binding IclR family transcriptional regulator